MMRLSFRLPTQFSLLFADMHGYDLSHRVIKFDGQLLMSESSDELRSLALYVTLSRSVDGSRRPPTTMTALTATIQAVWPSGIGG